MAAMATRAAAASFWASPFLVPHYTSQPSWWSSVWDVGWTSQGSLSRVGNLVAATSSTRHGRRTSHSASLPIGDRTLLVDRGWHRQTLLGRLFKHSLSTDKYGRIHASHCSVLFSSYSYLSIPRTACTSLLPHSHLTWRCGTWAVARAAHTPHHARPRACAAPPCLRLHV